MLATPSSPNPTPNPTSGGSLPPWAHRPAAAPPTAPKPVPAPVDIPGPWSRPAPVKPAAPAAMPTPTPAPLQPSMPVADPEKDWGPLKPIRTVPKPDEQKVAYILGQAERVVNPDDERSRKKWIILGSLLGVVVIAGGTFAFIFFGRGTQTPKLDTNALTIVDTLSKNKNVNTSGVFPNANTTNSNVNAANVNGATNGNTNTSLPPGSVGAFGSAVDTDGDGIADSFERYLGTDPNKADTDGDGHNDGVELANGYSPLDTGRVTPALYQKYCTNFTADIKFWTGAHRTAFCKQTGTIAGNAITALVAGDTTKELAILQAGNTTMLAWCKATFTKTSEEVNGSCVDAQTFAFAEFFQTARVLKPPV